jgi:nucleoside-diphosphate-sugar epimerase
LRPGAVVRENRSIAKGERLKVLVIGATGYLGGAAARALRARGHNVTAVGRSDRARARLADDGFAAIWGDVAAPEQLAQAAPAFDAVLYAVQLNAPDAGPIEAAALRAMINALGERHVFLYTSGVWYYGATGERVADETTPANPPPTVTWRPRLENIVLGGSERGIRPIVVRPGDVYGHAGGLPSLFVSSARESGAAKTFGDGANRWPVVHVDDLADLYVRTLEKAEGGVFNGTDDTSYTQREIARAASLGAGRGGATAAWPLDEAAAAMGEWVRNLALDQRVSSARARSRLGWMPRAATIVDELEGGSYVTAHPNGAGER